MKFCLIYRKDEELRHKILSQIVGWSKNTDFSKQEVNSNHFKIIPNHPPLESLSDLPLTLQAEYLEILDDKIICHKTLIVDTEVVLMPEEAKKDILVEKEVVVEKIPESTTIS